MTKLGIAHSNKQDAFQAATHIAETALRSGGLAHPDLVIAFCAGGLDHEEFFKGLQSTAPLFGQNRGLDWTGVLMIIAEHE